MSICNTRRGGLEPKSGAHLELKGGSGNESKRKDADKGSRFSESQLDQSSSNQNSAGNTPGGKYEQHGKAGEKAVKRSKELGDQR